MAEEKKEKCECKKCECCRALVKFLSKVLAVFLGTTFAILFCASVLRPKAPCGPCPFKNRAGIEKPANPDFHGQLPPKDVRK